jgi:arylsulfatase A-like enzyme
MRAGSIAAALASIAGLAAGAAGCGKGTGGGLEHPNIVLISIDTLRADHLGCYGYFRDTSPNLDRFAEQAILFEQAFATMATTLPSHASIFTSSYPLEHGILANMVHGGRLFGWKEEMLSFPQVAKDEGYTTAGFVGAAPLKFQTGINLGFDHWDQPRGRERRAAEVFAAVFPWLEEHAEERLFLFVHLYDTHWRFRAPEPFRSMFQTDEKLQAWLLERGLPDEAVRSQGVLVTETREEINGYCGEIRYVDDQLGGFFEKLRELELWDDSIVIVLSDHGEGLNQHSWASHGLVWEEQLRVPLLVRFPSGAPRFPRRFEGVVSLIDVFPTVMARMQPWATPLAARFADQASGVDVLAPGFTPRAVFAQRTGREVAEDPGAMYALTAPEWKLILEEGLPERLFDRRADPHELVNLASEDPEAVERAREELLASMREQTLRGGRFGEQVQQGEVEPELLKELQELGYMGGTPDE